tara:strand:- start:1803 stop:2300 length:498 start_codon:yes stop_codon:yes gene_type:complete
MTNQTNKKVLIFLLSLICIALIFAYIIEFKFDQQPCKLCLYQRIPYFLSIFLILTTLFFKSYEKIILLILCLVFIASSVLAFYHFGIEQGFFSETLACVNQNLSEDLSKEQLLEQLKENFISCKDVNFKIFGFSLAAINIIFSLLLSIMFLFLYKRCKKINKKLL